MRLDQTDFTKAPKSAPICIECGSVSRLGTGADAYPDEPELHDRPMWICACGAYAAYQPGTIKPIGLPALRETRQIQRQAICARTKARGAILALGRSENNARTRTGRAWNTVLRRGWALYRSHPHRLTRKQAEAVRMRMEEVERHAHEEALDAARDQSEDTR